MLRPSYAELMDVLNKSGEGKDVNSRYTVVIAAAKRARQLIDGDTPMVEKYNEGKPLSTAVEELYENKISVVGEGEGTVLRLRKDIEAEVREELKRSKLKFGAADDTEEKSAEAFNADNIAGSEDEELVDFDSDEDEE